jgi:hypothetical protein
MVQSLFKQRGFTVALFNLKRVRVKTPLGQKPPPWQTSFFRL